MDSAETIRERLKNQFHRGPDFIGRETLHELGDMFRSNDPRVREVYLFGSYSRGEATPESDVDLCVIYEGNARDIVDVVGESQPGVRERLWGRNLFCDIVAFPESAIEEVKSDPWKWPLLKNVLRDGMKI